MTLSGRIKVRRVRTGRLFKLIHFIHSLNKSYQTPVAYYINTQKQTQLGISRIMSIA